MAEIAEVRVEIAALRSELHAVRIEAKFEALKSDILGAIFYMILGTEIVYIIALVGAMFGVAKLLGH
jgi:hypothetical protein